MTTLIEKKAQEYSKIGTGEDPRSELGSYRQGLAEGFDAGCRFVREEIAKQIHIIPPYATTYIRTFGDQISDVATHSGSESTEKSGVIKDSHNYNWVDATGVGPK